MPKYLSIPDAVHLKVGTVHKQTDIVEGKK